MTDSSNHTDDGKPFEFKKGSLSKEFNGGKLYPLNEHTGEADWLLDSTSRFATPPPKKKSEPYGGGYVPPSGYSGGGGRSSSWDERKLGGAKWRKAATTNPRTGRHDPFTDPFFDPHGTRARMNRSSNLRSRSFNDKWNRRGGRW